MLSGPTFTSAQLFQQETFEGASNLVGEHKPESGLALNTFTEYM